MPLGASLEQSLSTKEKKVIFQLQDPSSTAPGWSSCKSKEAQRRIARNNQTLPKQPTESGISQDYVYHSPRRGHVGGLYQTPEWNQEEKIGSSHIYGKAPNCHPETWREEDPCRPMVIQTRRKTSIGPLEKSWNKTRIKSSRNIQEGGDICRNITINPHSLRKSILISGTC